MQMIQKARLSKGNIQIRIAQIERFGQFNHGKELEVNVFSYLAPVRS